MKREHLYNLGRPLSPLYALLMAARATLYRLRLLPVTRVAVPVVSIGNLTLGGTGKTPLVQAVARILQSRGLRPAIVSRGYGGAARGRCNVVSLGGPPLLSAADAGDEPRLLAETLPGIPVFTGRKRKFPARQAVESGAGVLVLDDGFQHLALHRDTNLVLFHADTLAGNSRVFPGGDLREPVAALQRADAFVLTGICEQNRGRADRFAVLLSMRFPSRPIFRTSYETAGVMADVDGGRRLLDISDLPQTPLFAFAGIARPETFAQTLHGLGLPIVGFQGLPDHIPYGEEQLAALWSQARAKGAAACITTEKDLVKLAGRDLPLPVHALRMEARLGEDLQDFLAQRLGGSGMVAGQPGV